MEVFATFFANFFVSRYVLIKSSNKDKKKVVLKYKITFCFPLNKRKKKKQEKVLKNFIFLSSSLSIFFCEIKFKSSNNEEFHISGKAIVKKKKNFLTIDSVLGFMIYYIFFLLPLDSNLKKKSVDNFFLIDRMKKRGKFPSFNYLYRRYRKTGMECLIMRNIFFHINFHTNMPLKKMETTCC